MALLTPEGIIRRVVSIYEDDYAALLDTVESTWATTEDITLPDFVGREITANPEVLPKVWDHPRLQVGAGPVVSVNESETRYQQYHDTYELDVLCFYYLRSSDARKLSLMIMRHMEATFSLLNQHPALDYGDNARVAPNSLSMIPSNAAPFSRGVLMKGLRVAFKFRFLQYGV